MRTPLFWPKNSFSSRNAGITPEVRGNLCHGKTRQAKPLNHAVEMYEDEAIRTLRGENSCYLTEQDVKEALLLRQKGEQRLRVVSDSETTWFYFAVSFDEHYGATEICVSPRPSHYSQNPFYHPSCRYTLCCEEARADELKDQQQAVYDGRIRPSQWRFGNDRYENISRRQL